MYSHCLNFRMSSKVRTVLLRDGPVGDRIEPWFRSRDDVDLLLSTSDKIPEENSQKNTSFDLDTIYEREPDLLLSAGYRHIVPKSALEAADIALNCHNSYLPHARGANANVWSIIEDGPAGVTIHEMVEKVDAGPIIAQRKVPVYPDDSGKDIYIRLIDAMVGLLEEEWPSIQDGTYSTKQNPISEGTYHTTDDFDSVCELNLESEKKVIELINILRALTFPPFDNAYFERDGEKYYVKMEIKRENSIGEKIQSASEN